MALPLIDRIGVFAVNVALLSVYVSMLAWALTTFLLIVFNANEPWPLSLALAFVVTFTSFHFGVMAAGALTVPGYELYPASVKPTVLYKVSDGAICLCFVAVCVSYGINSASSAAPLFSIFVLFFATLTNVLKIADLVIVDLRARESTST